MECEFAVVVTLVCVRIEDMVSITQHVISYNVTITTNERPLLHPLDQSEGWCFNLDGGGVGVDTGALYPS